MMREDKPIKQKKQKQIIYVFQELYPKTKEVDTEKIIESNNFERFYGFCTEETNFPQVEESYLKRIADYKLLIPHISDKLHKNDVSLSDYELMNLPINGSNLLESFEGSFKIYDQATTILRLPLFPLDFNIVREEFKRQSKLELESVQI